MLQQKKSIQQAVKTFYSLLRKYPDEIEHVFEYIRFLKYFIQVKPEDAELPLAEVITVLKNERKVIFHQIKTEAKYDMFLEMATELEVDYMQAKEKLDKISQ